MKFNFQNRVDIVEHFTFRVITVFILCLFVQIHSHIYLLNTFFRGKGGMKTSTFIFQYLCKLHAGNTYLIVYILNNVSSFVWSPFYLTQKAEQFKIWRNVLFIEIININILCLSPALKIWRIVMVHTKLSIIIKHTNNINLLK